MSSPAWLPYDTYMLIFLCVSSKCINILILTNNNIQYGFICEIKTKYFYY